MAEKLVHVTLVQSRGIGLHRNLPPGGGRGFHGWRYGDWLRNVIQIPAFAGMTEGGRDSAEGGGNDELGSLLRNLVYS